MADELDAAGTIAEGALLARAVSRGDGAPVGAAARVAPGSHDGDIAACLNCAADYVGHYCPNCGQKRHIHRSLGALWHDILHGVLHFDGKFWQTLPLLVWRPGDLTRRYLRGERAKFVSPMALFLFSIFMMFAVFSFAGSPFSGDVNVNNTVGKSADDTQSDYGNSVDKSAAEVEQAIASKSRALAAPGLSAEKRRLLTSELAEAKVARNLMAVMRGQPMPYPGIGLNKITKNGDSGSGEVDTGWPWLDKFATNAIKKANKSPDLLLYKLQSNGYKFAWLLIPISMPFIWLTMLGRRGYRFYDHAVFATYSISFMSLLFITCALLNMVSWLEPISVPLLLLYPPVHMYRQLRQAYQLGRKEAAVRLVVLLLGTVICLTLFALILLLLGVLG